jgi:hypothetical protein
MMALVLCLDEKPFGAEGDTFAKRAKAKRK